MSSSLKARIAEELIIAVFFFMGICILNKLLLPREDWLLHSIFWSICWTLGRIVAKIMAIMPNKGIRYFLYVDFCIIFVALIVVTFIVGVVISLPTWKEILGETVYPFGIALVVNNKWKRD